jgi:hypothetical protein
MSGVQSPHVDYVAAVKRIQDEFSMTQQTFTVEVKVDFEDKEHADVVHQAARDAARTLLAVSMMLPTKRKPKITLRTSDHFNGVTELNIDEE